MTIYSTEQTNVRTSETSPHPDKKIICIRTRNIPLKFKLSTNSNLIDNNNKWILWVPDKLRVALLTLGIRVEGPQLGHEDRQVVLDDAPDLPIVDDGVLVSELNESGGCCGNHRG